MVGGGANGGHVCSMAGHGRAGGRAGREVDHVDSGSGR